METLRKELADVEVEFNELKRNEAHLDKLQAEARAIVSQYDSERRARDKSYQEHMNHIKGIIGVDLDDADSEMTAVEANMVFKCDWLRTRVREVSVDVRQLLKQPSQQPPQQP